MSERSEMKNARVETFFGDLLSSYRWVPALAAVMSPSIPDDIADCAWLDLRSKILQECAGEDVTDISVEELENSLRCFIRENREWILYALYDMAFYAYKIGELDADETLEGRRWDNYIKRMQQQAGSLVWDEPAFNFDVKGGVLLDIGCGTIPYLSMILSKNKLDLYIGLDKRDVLGTADMSSVPFKFVEGDATTHGLPFMRDRDLPVEDINILFFAEVLHCFKNPIDTLGMILDNIGESVKRIAILELDGVKQRGLSSAFPFHMKMHGGFGLIDKILVSSWATRLGFSLECRKASSQHTLYLMKRF